jgi:acetolactate synthase regulatory subunit
MRYALLVTLREELGTVARLLLLLNQRGLHPEALSVARGTDGRLTAVVQLSCDATKARWAARQLRRMRSVEEARVLSASHLRQWVRLRVPARSARPLTPKGTSWLVVAEQDDHLVVECSGLAEDVAALASAHGAEVLLSLLQPPLEAELVPVTERRAMPSGRKVVLRQGRKSRLA